MAARFLALTLSCALLCGCSTTGKHWWAPATWGSSRPATRVAAAASTLDASQAGAVRSARSEVAKADLALAAAPASRPVEIARRTVGNAHTLLDQAAGPMPAAEAAAIRQQVSALLSDVATLRSAAEVRQAQDEDRIAAVSDQLARAGAALDVAQGKLAVAFTRENELADTLRNERAARAWWIGGGSLLILVLGGGWAYLQIATGGIPRAIGGVLKGLDSQAPEQANAIRALLDPALNRIEQALIRKHT